MIGPYYRAGSWVTIVDLDRRTLVGSMLLSDLQGVEQVELYITVSRPDVSRLDPG